jgi:N-glycosylase/DNA lyase
VWQIAQRDYRFGKSSNKNLNKTTYDAVANHFRKLWGKEAGWAHSVLFTADLRTFADKLAATKKIDVKVRVEDEESDVKFETKVTTDLSLEVPKEEDVDVKVKVEDIDDAKKPSGKKRKEADNIVTAAQTTETRRVSKRLRR